MNKKVLASIIILSLVIFIALIWMIISKKPNNIVPPVYPSPSQTNQYTTTRSPLPPEFQTQHVIYRQTQQAELLWSSATLQAMESQTAEIKLTPASATPTPFTDVEKTQTAAVRLLTYDPQQDYPQMNPYDPEWFLSLRLIGTLSGNGILIEGEDVPVYIQFYEGKKRNFYDLDFEYWYEERFDSYISIMSGVSNIEPGRGIVWVDFSPHYDPYQQFVIVETEDLTGSLKIIGAVGERLLLQSANDGVLYFDVPSVQFVNSLDEILPMATQVPTATYSITLSDLDDKEPDEPWMVNNEYSQTNVDLHSLINSPSDYDWFLFESLVPGEISVSFSDYPGHCGIRLVKLNYVGNIYVKFEDRKLLGAIIGEDISAGRGKKQLIVTEVQPFNYLVRVWCPDGSYSLEDPYNLRINVPIPLKVTPILECVAENPDGSYTAHFGYDNPNQYVVFVNADTSNNFFPSPVFRTGQPESFVPGRITDFFSVLFDGNDLTWTLDGTSVTANRNSSQCP